MPLSQQDLDVRLQKIGCCTGAQAKQLAQYYMYGSECNEEQLQKLTILNAYLDILTCYKVQTTTDTNWAYQFDLINIKELPIGSVIQIFIGGNLVAQTITRDSNTCEILNALNNALLGNEDVISSLVNCGGSVATITTIVPCSMTPAYARAYYEVEGEVYYYQYPVYIAQEGKCITGDKDNCITEEQIEVILENIAIMCKDCFKPNGFAYY